MHGCDVSLLRDRYVVGLPERTSYAASKFAVQGYCEALRGELASSGVTVHVASPGYIRTNLSRSAITGDGTPHGKMDSVTASGASHLCIHDYCMICLLNEVMIHAHPIIFCFFCRRGPQ